MLVDDPVAEGAHGAEMNSRGWQDFVPLLRWWEAHFARTAAGAREAAHLIVSEAQKQGARNPGDLQLADVRVEAENPGRLSLPGLGIASPI
ncbi:hypothetical protein ACFQ8Q_23535 [Streptomyces cyaneofuscatus]|uniref:hypothetical protein n=1 Tax=Streptomyces cyaneofuscatus TaxID=66883 RepID=UPI00369AF896